MKKKLIIFFLAVPLLILIYFLTYKEKYTYLALGDALAKGHTPFDTYSTSYVDYVYDSLKSKYQDITMNKDYIDEDLRIKDLTSLITNTKNESNYLPRLIKESSIITISLGSEELFSKIRSNNNINNKQNYIFIDDMFKDLEILLKEIKKLTKSPIYIIGYYSPISISENNKEGITALFDYIDKKFYDLETDNVHYVDINEGFINNSSYLPRTNNAFPSLEGYSYIANRITEKIES